MGHPSLEKKKGGGRKKNIDRWAEKGEKRKRGPKITNDRLRSDKTGQKNKQINK